MVKYNRISISINYIWVHSWTNYYFAKSHLEGNSMIFSITLGYFLLIFQLFRYYCTNAENFYTNCIFSFYFYLLIFYFFISFSIFHFICSFLLFHFPLFHYGLLFYFIFYFLVAPQISPNTLKNLDFMALSLGVWSDDLPGRGGCIDYCPL